MDEKEKKYIYNKIDTLNSILWENRVLKPHLEGWLNNFKKEEKDDALYLLSRCMYFGIVSIRAILRALYRDKYCSPVIQEIRRANEETLDDTVIERGFQDHLMRTRFVGVGNPSESGTHLLYYFRQENRIPKKLFVNTDDLYVLKENGTVELRARNIDHIVFIDDLCGSGSQIKRDSNVKRCVQNLRKLKKGLKISYLMMFGTKEGINVVKNTTLIGSEIKLFDEVEAVMELNESYKCFGEHSRYFSNKGCKEKIRTMSYKYGKFLIGRMVDRNHPRMDSDKRIQRIEANALGYGDCQLLLSLHHNTPNNTLPIIWFDEDNSVWTPIFKRYNKVY